MAETGLTVLRRRVGREPIGNAPAAGLLADPVQHVEHARRLARIVARRDQIAQPQVVGLSFVVAAELEEHQAHAHLRVLSVACDLGTEHGPETQAELRQLRLAHLVDAVARGDVADLVTTVASSASLLRWAMIPRVM